MKDQSQESFVFVSPAFCLPSYLSVVFCLCFPVEFSFTGVLNLLTNAWGKAMATKEPLKHEAEGPLYRVNNHLDHKYRPQSVNEIIASAKRLACDKEDYEFCSKTSEKFVNDLRYGKHPRLLVTFPWGCLLPAAKNVVFFFFSNFGVYSLP